MAGLSSKSLTFIAIMSALGNVLSFISIQLTPLIPNVSLGPVSISLAFDLSHVATFTAALFGGPVIGGLTGLIGGLVAAFEFGFSKGNIISGVGVPVGKALTGITAGYIMSRIDLSKRKRLFIPTTLISYIPEGIFTAIIFMVLLPAYSGLPSFLAPVITIEVLVKATIEMVLMGIILIGLYGNKAFSVSAVSYFPKSKPKNKERPESH